MRRILCTAAGVLALGIGSAMAQSAPPIPNASGSQTTNPESYGNTVNPAAGGPGQPITSGTCVPVPNASGSQATNPCTYGSTANDPNVKMNPGGPVTTGSVPPVPNASGSQTTNPETYRDTKPQ